MGDRVTQNGEQDLARASRLKRALESGAPPTFLPPATSPPKTNGSCAEMSCPVPPLLSQEQQGRDAAAHSQFLEQMSQASPDALCIADLNHRILWANATFTQMFGYSLAEIL